MSRILLLTSHPIDPPWDSADKSIAVSLIRHLPEHRFVGFGRAGATPAVRYRRVPIVARDGHPSPATFAQIALYGAALEPACDLVHAVMTIGPRFARLGALRHRLPARIRRPLIHTVPGVVDRQLLAGARPWGLTVALSRATADVLRDAGFGDVRVIAPGIPIDRWPVRPRQPTSPVVLFAGHYGAGDEEAVRAAAAASRRNADVRLVLAMRAHRGQNAAAENERLLRLARSEGLAGVEILGEVDDIPALIARSAVVLMTPSSLAGKADIPLVVLEALATGRPVVVSELPEFEALGAGVTRVPVGSHDAAGAAVAHLLSDPSGWEQRAHDGRALVERRFSERAMAEQYAQLYDEAIRRS